MQQWFCAWLNLGARGSLFPMSLHALAPGSDRQRFLTSFILTWFYDSLCRLEKTLKIIKSNH